MDQPNKIKFNGFGSERPQFWFKRPISQESRGMD